MSHEARIVELLTTKYGVDRERIASDARMMDLGLDSLTVAELLFDIEDAFGIEVSETDANITTFGDAVALVNRLAEAKGA